MNDIVFVPDLQLADADEVRRALALLLPAGQMTELRILDAVTSSDRWPHTASGYFDDADKLVAALEGVRTARSCYVIPNPINPALLARAANRIRKADKGGTTSDNDIVGRRWLLVDCDPQRPAGISATDAEHEAALERCRDIWNELHYNHGWPEPVAADSGNGAHLLYRVELPTDDNGLVQRCLAALAARFDDDAVKVDTGVFNPARIWKLYGTAACKGDSTPDRPHRMSRILSVLSSPVVVSREQLEELASDAPQTTPHEANGAVHNGAAFDIDAFIQRHGFELDGPDAYQGGRKWTFRTSPLCEHHGDGPYLIQFPSGALSAGCHHNSCAWTWHDLRAKYEPKPEAGLYERLIGKVSGNGTATASPLVTPRIEYQRITSAELASGTFAVDFLIEHTLVAGQPLIIAGPQKSLKTSLLIDAAVSLEGGGCFLGRLPVSRPRRVAVMTGESGLAAIQETAKRICDAAGRRLEDCDQLIWSPDIPKFGKAEHLDALERFLAADAIEVLFVDPAYLAMPSADAGNLMAQGELLSGMAELCQRLGVTLCLAHHTRKGTGRDPFEPMELQDIAWAGFGEFARQWWLLNRREKYEPGTGDHRLWLSVGGSAGHSALWAVDVTEGLLSDAGGRRWDVTLSDAAGAREATTERKQQALADQAQQQMAADRAAVCRVLAKHPSGLTQTAIRDHAQISGRRWPGVLATMLELEEVTPIDIITGNQKTPKTGYRLRQSENH